ncbi:MAG: S-layer homology domain-containing protein, partial [Clostridia bacterium]
VKDKVAQVAANYAEEISLSISKPVMSVGYPSFCDITFPQGVSIKSGTDIVWKSSMIYAVTIQSHDNERATLFGAGAGQSLVSATGKFNHPDPDKAGQTIKAVAEAVITVRSGGGGTDSGTEGGDTTSFAVYYDVGAHGTISGATSESVVNGRKPARVPNVVAASGYLFKGWSINGTTIVIPQMYTVRSSTTFKAVYEQIKDPQLADEHKAYIGGYSDGTFRPENKITRAEAVAMFARIMKTPIDPNATYTNKFTDVPSDKWFANAVGFMSQFGIIGGYTDGSFRPNNIVTRAEFAAMIVRFNNVTNSGKSVFSDVADSFWGKNDIMAAYNSGWITGYSDGTFRPQVGITRAETVKVVNTMLGRVIDASSIAGAVYKTFSDVTTKHWAYYYVIEASCDHGYTMENGKEIWARG